MRVTPSGWRGCRQLNSRSRYRAELFHLDGPNLRAMTCYGVSHRGLRYDKVARFTVIEGATDVTRMIPPTWLDRWSYFRRYMAAGVVVALLIATMIVWRGDGWRAAITAIVELAIVYLAIAAVIAGTLTLMDRMKR
jgi:hypothetical protein